MNNIFKKSVVISLMGHLAVFSVFSVSFGRRLTTIDYTSVVFKGRVLNKFDLAKPFKEEVNQIGRLNTTVLLAKNYPDNLYVPLAGYLKPFMLAAIIPEKGTFIQSISAILKNKEKTAVMFYPNLPHYFSIYFKDRQLVHMELMFKVPSVSRQNSPILIKRKISSGNLEADLLCMRYINHYLFVQRGMFAPLDKEGASGGWQAVKIELSCKK